MLNRLVVGFHLDLRDGFDRDGDALLGVEILLRGHVERHEFERQAAADLDHRKHDCAVSLNDARSAHAIDDQRLVGTRFAIKPGHGADEKQNHHDCRASERSKSPPCAKDLRT